MSKITVRFVRDDGRAMSIDDQMIGLVAAKGLDTPNVQTFTQKAAVGYGDLVTGQRVGSRVLEFTGVVKNPALNDVMRRAYTSFFTTGRTYNAFITRYGARRYAAGCYLENLDIPTANQYAPITIKLSLLMPEGLFLSEDSFGKNIAGIEERCGYPYVALAPYGRLYGIFSYAGLVYLDNDGDAESYCNAVFVAKGGEAVNPKLLAGSGYVRVICTMQDGDVLIINGQTKGVTLNGVNAATMLDKTSDFSGVTFGIGTNTVGFTADLGANILAVNIYFNKRYLGV